VSTDTGASLSVYRSAAVAATRPKNNICQIDRRTHAQEYNTTEENTTRTTISAEMFMASSTAITQITIDTIR